jgi:penicillin amidase
MLEIDRFFRRMNWGAGADAEVAQLSPAAREAMTAYCEGVNAGLAKGIPWELKLLGYRRPEPWTAADSILISRMTGYLTLAQSQGEMERFLVQAVQAGIDRARLDELFPGILGGLDEALLRQVRLTERIVPESLVWGSPVPRMMASNNWVVSGARTASGKPILANDPHLEINRLPAVWYEIVLRTPERYAISATMPGIPGLLLGRTSDVAWGATYTFMDAIDSWVERCKDGLYYREPEGWKPFHVRRERILRKGKAAVEVEYFENDHGVLDGDPRVEGHYLCTRWSAARSGARSVNGIVELWDARTVDDGMRALGGLETAWNWVLADRHGNIGYQMSGLCPRRREGVSGFVPLPGWRPENDWQGFVPYEELPRCKNPPTGIIVTANNDLNAWGRSRPINLCMGGERAERIERVLSSRGRLTWEEMRALQFDVHSLHADRFLAAWRPYLPETENGRLLREWNCGYEPESRGAVLFERVYQALLSEVFSGGGVGQAVMDHLISETSLPVDFFANFDRVLLSESSAWFAGRSRAELFRKAIDEGLSGGPPGTWGERQQLVLKHILFGGKLPRALGFDRGPITLRGGRATPHQGQVYRSAGRDTSFAPSIRLIVDFGEEGMRTNLVGGPSDRRFSKWYCSDLGKWLEGRYKVLKP